MEAVSKYILILAEDGDSTVNDVMAWIDYFGYKYVLRINNTDKIHFINLEINNQQDSFEIVINEQVTIKSSEIKAYWYRRGEISYSSIGLKGKINEDQILLKSVDKYYKDEFLHISEYLHHQLRNIAPVSINSFKDIFTNKLINLQYAKQVGLNIPDSIVSNNPSVIKDFISLHNKCIVKPIRYPGYKADYADYTISFSQYSNLVTFEDIQGLELNKLTLQPSHLQAYVEKEFEIRAFILFEEIYAMAIFSQQNEKTKVDFRNYDTDLPNRNIAIKLPTELENKLIRFCKIAALNCGSIDLLYKNGNYTFLEINPVGQLQWLSQNCNYEIEKVIAQKLIGL